MKSFFSLVVHRKKRGKRKKYTIVTNSSSLSLGSRHFSFSICNVKYERTKKRQCDRMLTLLIIIKKKRWRQQQV